MAHIQVVTQTSIDSLRALIGHVHAPGAGERISAPDLPMGIPRGAVTEVFGPEGCGKTEWCLRMLARNSELRVAWIENEFTPFPTGFLQRGVALNRILFVEAMEKPFWYLKELLQSKLFDVVVASGMAFPEKQLRALQLCCERTNGALILLNREPHSAWPITMQIEVTTNPRDELRIELRRMRGVMGVMS